MDKEKEEMLEQLMRIGGNMGNIKDGKARLEDQRVAS